MERVEPPQGYIVKDRESVEELLEVEAELLRSEGIDPTWPGLADDHRRDDRDK
jgi:hypothetical protein